MLTAEFELGIHLRLGIKTSGDASDLFLPGVCEPPLTEFCLRANGLWMNITGCKANSEAPAVVPQMEQWLFMCASFLSVFCNVSCGEILNTKPM